MNEIRDNIINPARKIISFRCRDNWKCM